MKNMKQVLFDYVIEQATAIHLANAIETKKPDEKPDPKQAAIQAIFDRDEPFGCHTKAVAELVEHLTGYKFNVKNSNRNRLPRFTVAVPVTATGSNHGHALGKPVICLGAEGNCFNGVNQKYDYVTPGNVMKPTNAEFNEFISKTMTPDNLFSWVKATIGLGAIVDF